MRNELFPPHASFLYAKRWGFSHAPVVSHFITSRTFVITNYVLRVWKPAPAHQKTSFENEIRKNRVKFAYLTIGKTIRVVNLNVSHMLCEFARSGLIPWQQKKGPLLLTFILVSEIRIFRSATIPKTAHYGRGMGFKRGRVINHHNKNLLVQFRIFRPTRFFPKPLT